MALTANLVHGFAGSILAKRYDNATPTPGCHLEWWELCCGPDPLVAIAAPRGHGKSTAISHAYTLAAVLFRERRFVVLVSDTESQAQNFLNDIKEELRNNDDLIELFQIKGFLKDTETDIICETHDGHSFRIMVRGAEQRVRGLKWQQMRPDLIICHEKDTPVYTPETGWIKNSDHPKARHIKAHEAFIVEFEDGTKETISGDHRFWIEGKGWMFPWELRVGMNVEEGSLESTMQYIERSIKSESKHLGLLTKLLIKAKQTKQSTKQTIQMLLFLQSVNGTSKIKRWCANKLWSLLKPTLHGKPLTALNEGLQS